MSLRARSLGLFLGILSCLLIIGCSSPARRFAHARELQQQGKPEAALREYVAQLGHVPATQQRVSALLEFHIGECLWVLQKPKEAYDALRKSVAEDPSNPEARLRLAEVALAGGAPDIAVDQSHAVLAAEPNNLEALSVLGAAFASEGNAAMARSALERVVTADPSRVSSAIALAEIEAQQRDFAAARTTLERGVAAAPHDASPWLALARMEELQGELPEAERCYREAVAADNSPEASLRLAQFLARMSRISESETVLANLGKVHRDLDSALPDFDLFAGRTSTAIDAYSHLQEQHSDTAATDARIIEAELENAQQLAASGEDPKPALENAARELNSRSSELDRGTRATLNAELALAHEDLPAALARGAEAVNLSPESPSPYYVLGLAHQRKGDNAAASAAFEQALQKDSHFLPARQALAQQQLESGDVRSAEDSISQVVLEEPANFDALCLFARVLAAQGRAPEAAQLAHRAQAANPAAAEPRIILGDIASTRGQLGLALLQYEQAVLLAPNSPAAVGRLTRLYRDAHITAPMLHRMEKMAASPPISAPLMEIAGRLYAQRGWLTQARRCFRQTLQMDPHRTTAAAALVHIDLAQGNFTEAEQLGQMLGSGSISLTAGIWASQHGDLNTAAKEYEHALAQGDRTGIAANNLAWIYAQQGVQLDRALALANAAHESLPQSPEILDTLGMVRVQRHEYSKAVEAFKEALALGVSESTAAAEISTFRAHLKKAYLLSGDDAAAHRLTTRVTSNLP